VSELPTGTVTFLFTDLETSTHRRRVEDRPGAVTRDATTLALETSALVRDGVAH
jgi:hypothetical protein